MTQAAILKRLVMEVDGLVSRISRCSLGLEWVETGYVGASRSVSTTLLSRPVGYRRQAYHLDRYHLCLVQRIRVLSAGTKSILRLGEFLRIFFYDAYTPNS